MNFHQWKSRMRNLQIQTGPAFEDVLLRHFQQCKNEVKRNPTLPNGRTPDFLVTDANGATCYVEAKFFMPPRDKAQYARITTPSTSLPRVKPHTRDRIYEKVESEIACRYPATQLGSHSMVLAIFDYSTEDMVDFEGELCTTPPTESDIAQFGHTPPRFWSPSSENPVTIANIQAVWEWIPVPVNSARFGRIAKPVLYTNPYNQLALPNSLRAFNHITWSPPNDPSTPATASMTDGGMPYDFAAVRQESKYLAYVEQSRTLAQQVRDHDHP